MAKRRDKNLIRSTRARQQQRFDVASLKIRVPLSKAHYTILNLFVSLKNSLDEDLQTLA